MTSAEIRDAFLEFFRQKDHRVVPSSSLVPDDPTLHLTAAGMVQFKPVFLNKTKVDYTRAASSQKCVRTTDIERVGHTARHLTFFEMLGNFSFGDYYKKEASAWAWEFLIGSLALPVDKLWVTIFETDEEAHDIWVNEIGVDPDRVVRLGEKDNFWAAGPTGPCGPCSEIIYDFGPERSCGEPDCGVGCDCDRYLEIWNLVFMQYNRDQKGELHPLPKKNIDTGMGLERIASVLQGVETNFEIDIIKPLIEKASDISGVKLGDSLATDVSLKVIADHLRAVTFMIADGVLPSNEGRGYVLRRLIRRAVRHGRLLGIKEPFAAEVAQATINIMGPVYSQLPMKNDTITSVVSTEEERFDHTLRQGLAVIQDIVARARESKSDSLPAEEVFKLYDTYGFPLELTEEIAAESDLKVDRKGFDDLMESQRERARAGAVSGHAQIFVKNAYPQIKEQFGDTEFVGYQDEEVETKVTALIVGDTMESTVGPGATAELFLERTPFYAEKGGQVGDTGFITSETGRAKVLDTTAPLDGLYSHTVEVVEGELRVDDNVTCSVDHRRRMAIARNHTGTHLLHWALRAVLGEQATQAGSLVDADKIRFDFRHHQALSSEELSEVERLVNEKAFQDHPVRVFTTSIEYAKEIGAVALFGEKYGKFVRVVEVGNFSRELCGGVHLHSTSQLGVVKITSEGSVGSGLRRIEALTGEALWSLFKREEALLADVAAAAGANQVAELPGLVAAMNERLAAAETRVKAARSSLLAETFEAVACTRQEVNGLDVFASKVEGASMDELLSVADKLRERSADSVVILASEADSKVLLLVAAGKQAVAAGVDSGKMVKGLAGIVGGGGGGRPDLAQAGGSRPEKIPEMLEEAGRMLRALPVSS